MTVPKPKKLGVGIAGCRQDRFSKTTQVTLAIESIYALVGDVPCPKKSKVP